MAVDAATNAVRAPVLPEPRIHMPKVSADDMGAWLGGAVIWGVMTAGVTRQIKPALVSAGVVGASSVARLYVREAYPSNGKDGIVVGSGALMGTAMGAAVGACVMSGAKGVTSAAMLRGTAKGMGVGAVVGVLAGVAQAKFDTFLM